MSLDVVYILMRMISNEYLNQICTGTAIEIPFTKSRGKSRDHEM